MAKFIPTPAKITIIITVITSVNIVIPHSDFNFLLNLIFFICPSVDILIALFLLQFVYSL